MNTLNIIREAQNEYGNNFTIGHSEALIAKVKKSVLADSDVIDRLIEEPENEEHIEKNNSIIDYAVRFKYAKVIANIHHLSGWKKTLFVEIRMNRLWKYTDITVFDDLCVMLEKHYGTLDEDKCTVGVNLNSCWGVDLYAITALLKKCSLSQINRILGLASQMNAPRFQNTVCMTSMNYSYERGFHHGEWLSKLGSLINRGHMREFNTFMKVMQRTLKISNSPVPSRYLRVLGTLPENTLRMTVQDRRNWTYTSYGDNRSNYYFRLNVIVTDKNMWEPIRLPHIRNNVWDTKFNRIPKNKAIYELPIPIIEGFTKKSFGLLVKELATPEWVDAPEHSIVAMAKAISWFGHEWRIVYKNALYNTDTPAVPPLVHEVFINLPEILPFKDGRDFVRKNIGKWGGTKYLFPIVKNWECLIEQGIDPSGKSGVEKALAYLATLLYDNVRDSALAAECGKWNLTQEDFESVQKFWVERPDLVYETIPRVDITQGDFRFYLLDRNDPRGIFLGLYTNCCQHPSGAGKTCAAHGSSSRNGGFVVLEYRGEIKFQAWVWRHKNSIVFDSIEGRISAELNAEAHIVFLKGIKAFKGRLCITNAYVGTGYGGMNYDSPTMSNPCQLPDGVYTDARSVIQIF